jgi:agmatinase
MDQGKMSAADAQAFLRATPSFLGVRIGDFQDLRPGCVALAGVFCDHSAAGQPGSRFAPRQLRYLGRDSPRETNRDEDVIDIGDLNVFPLQPQRNAQILVEQSERIAATGASLLTIGGDYSIIPHIVEGLLRAHRGKALGLIRVARRVDFQDVENRSTRASATFRINELLGGQRANIVLLGAQSPLAIEELSTKEMAAKSGGDEPNAADDAACIIPMHALVSAENVRLDQAMHRLRNRCDAVYLSVDADVLSPLYGETSSPRSACGLGPASLMSLLDRFVGIPLLGADVMGHVPNLDLAGTPATSVMACVVNRVTDLLLGKA